MAKKKRVKKIKDFDYLLFNRDLEPGKIWYLKSTEGDEYFLTTNINEAERLTYAKASTKNRQILNNHFDFKKLDKK